MMAGGVSAGAGESGRTLVYLARRCLGGAVTVISHGDDAVPGDVARDTAGVLPVGRQPL